MIPQRGLLENKTWSETLIDLRVYELNVGSIPTAKRFSRVLGMLNSWEVKVLSQPDGGEG